MSTCDFLNQLTSKELSSQLLRAMANQTLPKLRNERDMLIYLLIHMGWTTMADTDDEIVFVKHLYPKTDQKRSIIQLIVSPSLGTGLYHFRRTLQTFQIEEHACSLKLRIADLDAFPVNDHTVPKQVEEDCIYVTDNDLGLDGFIDYLMKHEWITEDDLPFFTMMKKERAELAKQLPVLYLECGPLGSH